MALNHKDRLRLGYSAERIRHGYRVIGPNTGDGGLSVWYYPTLEAANEFAKFASKDTGYEYDVVKYLGSWAIQLPPTEWIPAEDVPMPGSVAKDA